MEGGGGGMDIKEGDEESDDDVRRRRARHGRGRRPFEAVASAGQYGKADEEFEDAMEAAAGGSTSSAALGRSRIRTTWSALGG